MTQLSVQRPSLESRPLRLLVVGAESDWPLAVHELTGTHSLQIKRADNCRTACDPSLLALVDAVIVCMPTHSLCVGFNRELQLLADALNSNRTAGVICSDNITGVELTDQSTLAFVPQNVTADELWGRIATIRQYRPLLASIEEQVSVMQRLGKKLNQQFVEVDQELRLASRLQRDFLPRSFPEVGAVRFAALYRPATWVSGDVYDVRRLDENNISFYLADAVGHGVAAGLLTMFIKQAIGGKRIDGENYAILSPTTVLADLNHDLAKQELPNCQFITACYAVINAHTGQINFSRGGHPHPIHVSADGECTEVHTIGGLLGVFPEESFPSTSLTLKPGEKFIIYSDGLEDLLIHHRDRDSGTVHFSPEFREFVRRPVKSFLESLTGHLDRSEGSLQPDDDMTLLAVEHIRS